MKKIYLTKAPKLIISAELSQGHFEVVMKKLEEFCKELQHLVFSYVQDNPFVHMPGSFWINYLFSLE
jgi:hypothetical protein